MKWRLGILAVVLGFVSIDGFAAQADVNVFLDYDQSGQSTMKTTSMAQYLNLAYGVPMTDRVVVGGKVYYHRETSSVAGASGTTTTFSAVGPYVGYGNTSGDGLWFDLTILLLPTQSTKAESELTLYGGSGVALGAGYLMKVGSWSIGPMVQYIHADYKKQKSGESASELAAAEVASGLQQYVAFRYVM